MSMGIALITTQSQPLNEKERKKKKWKYFSRIFPAICLFNNNRKWQFIIAFGWCVPLLWMIWPFACRSTIDKYLSSFDTWLLGAIEAFFLFPLFFVRCHSSEWGWPFSWKIVFVIDVEKVWLRFIWEFPEGHPYCFGAISPNKQKKGQVNMECEPIQRTFTFQSTSMRY